MTPRSKVRILLAQPFAGVAELADALDLGSSSSECRFDSCHPHHYGNNKVYESMPFYFAYDFSIYKVFDKI